MRVSKQCFLLRFLNERETCDDFLNILSRRRSKLLHLARVIKHNFIRTENLHSCVRYSSLLTHRENMCWSCSNIISNKQKGPEWEGNANIYWFTRAPFTLLLPERKWNSEDEFNVPILDDLKMIRLLETLFFKNVVFPIRSILVT